MEWGKGKRMLEKGEKGTVLCTVPCRDKGMQNAMQGQSVCTMQHTVPVCNVSTVVYLQGTVLYCTVGTMRRTVYTIQYTVHVFIGKDEKVAAKHNFQFNEQCHTKRN
jgi:hypothetical protein